jgi:hypothetical protein
MTYSFTDHLHTYAVWTAARASQRAFTTTANIKGAIDKTELKNLITEERDFTLVQFDEFHKQTAKIIIDYLNEKEIITTYGRAAKIIAIYLKTAIVIRNSGQGSLAKILHPPIDRILLTNLNKKIKSLELKEIKWTQLTETDYFEIIEKLRTLKKDYFWELEEYWTV